MTNQFSIDRSVSPLRYDLGAFISLSGPGDVPAPLEWLVTGEDLRSAKAQLNAGGVVYLSVERLGSTGWDWLVWDSSCQVPPRHGLAGTERAAKRQAELSMREVDAVLHLQLGRAEQGAAAGSAS